MNCTSLGPVINNNNDDLFNRSKRWLSSVKLHYLDYIPYLDYIHCQEVRLHVRSLRKSKTWLFMNIHHEQEKQAMRLNQTKA